MPFKTLRSSTRAGPRPRFGKCGSITAHSSSVRSNRAITCSFAEASESDLLRSFNTLNWVQTLEAPPHSGDNIVRAVIGVGIGGRRKQSVGIQFQFGADELEAVADVQRHARRHVHRD